MNKLHCESGPGVGERRTAAVDILAALEDVRQSITGLSADYHAKLDKIAMPDDDTRACSVAPPITPMPLYFSELRDVIMSIDGFISQMRSLLARVEV